MNIWLAVIMSLALGAQIYLTGAGASLALACTTLEREGIVLKGAHAVVLGEFVLLLRAVAALVASAIARGAGSVHAASAMSETESLSAARSSAVMRAKSSGLRLL